MGAVSVTLDKDIVNVPFGPGIATMAKIAMSNSYAAGGDTFTPQNFGMSRVLYIIPTGGDDGLKPEVDITNKKVKVMTAAKLRGHVSLDFPSIAADSTGIQTATITGAATTDLIFISAPDALPAGLLIESVEVTSANTITVAARNVTAGAIDAAALNFDYIIFGQNGEGGEVAAGVNLSAVTFEALVVGLP